MDDPPLQLPGSDIQYRQHAGQFELYLPPNFRGLAFAAPVALLLIAAVVCVALLLDLPPVAAAGLGLPLFFFLILLAAAVRPHLMRTWVTITNDRLTLKTIGYRKVNVQSFELSPTSRATRSWVKPRRSASTGRGRTGGYYQGVDVHLEVDAKNRPVGETVHFGDSLRRSEGAMEWIVWRINRFLGHPDPAHDPQVMIVAAGPGGDPSPAPEEPVQAAAPKPGRFRIEEDGNRIRFHFPSTRRTGTWRGAGSILIGLAMLAWPAWSAARRLIRDAPAFPTRPAELAAFLFAALLALLGLAELMKGINRVFGQRTLSISPDRIVYRATVLGIPVKKRLPTRDVLLTRGFAIHTAHRKIELGAAGRDAARTDAEAKWLAREIRRRTQAACSAA